jgi:hypothetical protein
MDATWIGMLIVWAIVEFIQFLRKKTFLQRMRTGAVWSVLFMVLAFRGAPVEPSLLATAIALVMYSGVAAVIYWFRLLLASGWRRVFPKKILPSR